MAFFGAIINTLYPCIMPLNIPDKAISHFIKCPRSAFQLNKQK